MPPQRNESRSWRIPNRSHSLNRLALRTATFYIRTMQTTRPHPMTCSSASRRFLPILLILAGFQSASAQGYAVFDFLRIPMNARAAALGNSFLTVRNDPAVIFMNPGGLSTLEATSASIGFLKYVQDFNAGYAAYGQQLPNIGWIGAGVTYINYGTFEGYDKFANPTGTFGAGDLAVSVGYGNRHENLHYGAAIKFIYSSIASFNSTGLAVDAGVDYVFPKEELVLGLSVLSLGAQLSPYGETTEDLPFEVKIGVSKKLEHLPLTLMLNFHKLNETRDNVFDRLSSFSIGGEILFSEAFRGRLGYNNEMRRELKIGESARLAGFSAGFGLDISSYTLDYAFTSFGRIPEADNHRVSLRAAF